MSLVSGINHVAIIRIWQRTADATEHIDTREDSTVRS
jgi:hypothetical protein